MVEDRRRRQQHRSRGHSRNGQSSSHRNHIRLSQNDDDFSFISPCVKYSLFFFNLIFWIIGGTFVSLGLYSFLDEYNETNLPKVQSILDVFLNISLALIIFGGIIFSMSLFGCLGALRENLCLLKLYSLMLLLLFICEICLSTIAFMFPNLLSHFVKENLSKEPIVKYRDDANLQNIIDFVQTKFKCCGVSDKGYKDWSQNIYFNCTPSNPSPEKCAVPYSCCRNTNTLDVGLNNIKCGNNVQKLNSVVEVNKYIYTKGCIEAITEIFDMIIVAIVCLGSAIIQLLAMFLARSLQGQIMAQRARWM